MRHSSELSGSSRQARPVRSGSCSMAIMRRCLKSFADPFPDPRTDYLIVPLAKANRRPTYARRNRSDVAAWDLVEALAQPC